MENTLRSILDKHDTSQFLHLNKELTFFEYIDLVFRNPKLIRTSHQLVYDMILSKGSYTFEKFRKQLTHYNFFDHGKYPIFGLEETLDKLVKFIKGAAGSYGTEKRVLLLNGPVGTSKSTIVRSLKRGLEEYSKTDEGAWYTFKWIELPTGQSGIYTSPDCECQMNEDPIRLIPIELRAEILKELNRIHAEQGGTYTLKCEGDLDPKCKKLMNELLLRYKGNWHQVVKNHIKVVRKVFSEVDRVGIATFQPKDEKSLDATELTGDIDWSKLPYFGDDSNSLAFSFSGEFSKANRGIIEFIEMLKLPEEFLYDLLGATQEQQIKPKKFCQVAIDEFIISHSNLTETKNFCTNQRMEALRDRTIKIEVPYLLRLSDEIKILEADYNKNKVKQHIAPHTLEIAALWAILTRLHEEDKITLVQKAKLYNGEDIEGFTEDSVREMAYKHSEEGMKGVSVRYVQEKISNCLCERPYINAFMVLSEIKDGLDHSSLISDKSDIAKYHNCVQLAIEELDDILKDEIRMALVGDGNVLEKLCASYIDNLMAYIKGRKIRNKITQRDESPNERLMRSVEEHLGVPQQGVDDFRRSIAAFIGDMAHDKREFKWDSHSQLRRAFEAKLFEDVKDHIKISALSVNEASTIQPDIQEKIDTVKKRLIDDYGYNEQSATDVLEYVSSVFARGESVRE